MATIIGYMILIVTACIYAGAWTWFNREKTFDKVTDVLAIGLYHINRFWDMIPDSALR